MIRRSGVSEAVCASGSARGTARRSASGQSDCKQVRKFAAAARIASAVINGWPEAPDSPLHSGAAGDTCAWAGTEPVVADRGENRVRMSKPWPLAVPPTATSVATPKSPAARVAFDRKRVAIWVRPWTPERLIAARLPRGNIYDCRTVNDQAPILCRFSAQSPANSRSKHNHVKAVRKAIFPVAGLGTRFLPATKAMPKEMLTLVDRPLIQHVVDEARQAGIEHFIFVTGRNK